jgi:hypothetical protein
VGFNCIIVDFWFLVLDKVVGFKGIWKATRESRRAELYSFVSMILNRR